MTLSRIARSLAPRKSEVSVCGDLHLRFFFFIRNPPDKLTQNHFFRNRGNIFYEKRRIRSLAPDTLTRNAGYAHVQSERIRHMRNSWIRSLGRRIRSLRTGYAHLAPDTLTMSVYSTPAGYAHFQKTCFDKNLYLKFLILLKDNFVKNIVFSIN